jgi:hypothetical protein
MIFSLLNMPNRMNVSPLGLIIKWKSMEVMTVLDEIMVNRQTWPHKDWVELHATKVTTWNEFCCFNATP